MSDSGKRDIELRIRAQDLSTADFQRVSAAIKELAAAVSQETEAAKKGAVGIAELTARTKELEAAGKSLTSLQTAIDRFKDLTGVVAANEAKVTTAAEKLTAFRAQLDTAGTTSKKAETQLAGYVKQLEAAEAGLAKNRAALVTVSEGLSKAGIDTANLTAAERELKVTADQVGVSLTALNDTQLAYARNTRLAKEATAALKAEQQAAVTAAKAQAAAVQEVSQKLKDYYDAKKRADTERQNTTQSVLRAQNDAEKQAYNERIAETKRAETERQALATSVLKATNQVEKREYNDRVTNLRQFNAETARLAEQSRKQQAQDRLRDLRQQQDQEQNAVTAGLTRAGLRQAPGAGGAARGTPGRPSAPSSDPNAATGLFGLRPYELQNLSYQVNDIISGLISGQRVTQIAAQQGGQVLQLFNKNLFDLAKYLPAIGAGVAAFTVAIAALNAALRDSEAVRQYTGLLKTVAGGESNYSASQLVANEHDLRAIGVSRGDARQINRQAIDVGLNQDQIKNFAQAAQDLTDTGREKDVVTAFKNLSEEFSNGVDGIRKLSAQYGLFSADQLTRITQLYNEKRGQEALNLAIDIAFKKLRDGGKEAVGPATQAYRDLNSAWDNFTESLSKTGAIQGVVNYLVSALTAIRDMIGTLRAFDSLLGDIDKKYPWAKYLYTGQIGLIKGAVDLSKAGAGALGLTAPPGTAPNPPGSNNEQAVMAWLQQHGYSSTAAAAIMGNTSVESSFNPGARNATGHFGLFQWDQARQAPLGGSTNISAQMELMDRELNALDSSFKKSTDSAEILAARFEKVFERSGGQLLSQRVAKAQGYAQSTTDVPGSPAGVGADAAGSSSAYHAIQSRIDAGHETVRLAEQELKIRGDSVVAAAREAFITKTKFDIEKQLPGVGAEIEQSRQKLLDIALKEYDAQHYDQRRQFEAQIAAAKVSDGKNAEAIYQAGVKNLDVEKQRVAQAGRTMTQAEAYKAILEGMEESRKKFAQSEKEDNAERELRNQLASLNRQNQLKDTDSLENHLKAVSNQYETIRNAAKKLAEESANATTGGRAQDFLAKINPQIDTAEQQAKAQGTAEFYVNKLNSLTQQRTQLVAAQNAAYDAGAITATEREDAIKRAFDATTPAIAATGSEFQKFLSTTKDLDPTKIDLYTAKIKEFQATATYISPLMKDIKTAVENSFTTGLTNSFNTVAEAVGGLITKTKSWGDVLLSVRDAAVSFFAGLLKDIAAAIIKYEALKIASSLGLTSGGGIISTLFGGAASAAGGGGVGAAAGGGGVGAAVVLHGGGIAGRTSSYRDVPSYWFANAPRYHSGYPSIGLAANEQAAILQHGEEVLTRDSPRNMLNANRSSGSGGIAIRSVLVQDQRDIPAAMSGAHGERVVISHITRNAATLRQVLKG